MARDIKVYNLENSRLFGNKERPDNRDIFLTMFREDNYITIPGFAITRHGLSGNELICYSLIYGFSQSEGCYFTGSLTYIAKALNISKRTAIDVLNRLQDRGLIIKEEEVRNNVKYCKYQIVRGDSEETSQGVVKKLHRGSEETSPNNLNNIDNNNTNTPLISPQGETPQESISKNKKSAKAKPSAASPFLVLPFSERKTVKAWYELCEMPKWRNKPQSAIEKALKKLSNYSDDVVLAAIEDAIMGNYQGIFPDKFVKRMPTAPQQPKKKYINIEDIM